VVDTYYTANQKRRDAARASGPNGIDFVRVDRSVKPPLLRVQLFHPATGTSPGTAIPFTAEIAGGVFPVSVQSVTLDATVADRTRLAVAPGASGDTSTYTLRLIQSASSPVPPDGFDPLLSSVDFSFAPQDVRETDCAVGPVPVQPDAPEPSIDYLAKDWTSFRQLLLDRLSSVAPDWTERNPADLGAAVVEILAYAADHLSYYQDAVATEAYLGTARRRISVRRHARLLDYLVHEGANARAWVSIEVDADSVTLGRADTRFLTRCRDGVVVLPPGDLGELLETFHSDVFEPVGTGPWTLRRAHNPKDGVPFYTFDGDVLCLPAGSTRATLDDPNRELQLLAAGDVLVFEEVLGPATGLAIDADPSHRHAVRLTRATPYVDASNKRPVVDIAWSAEDALPFSLCLANPTTLQPLSVARGNVLLVDHGLTVGPERLPVVPDDGPYRPRLAQRELSFIAALPSPLPSAAATLVQDPRAALPAVTSLEDDRGNAWTVARDLLHARPTDRFAVIEVDDRGGSCLRFGDGTLGAQPAAGTALSVAYRVGNGKRGNVAAGAIVHVVTGATNITRVTNPLPAVGGTEPEPLDHVRVAAPQSFRVQERAVTERDYGDAAERFPGVRKAAAHRRFLGSYDAHFVAVLREGGVPLDPGFASDLVAFLGRFRLTGTEITVVPPVIVPLDIYLTINVSPGHLRAALHDALLAAFSAVDLPDGRRGFFHPDNFTFGQPVYLGQVVSAIMVVGGVASVDTADPSNRFRRQNSGRDELRDGRIAIGPLEIAAAGSVDFHLEGGL
jgi:hypothetical protein